MTTVVATIGSARLRAAEPEESFAGAAVDVATEDWIDVTVPGDVRAALVAAGRIEDPDRDPTDQLARWIDEKEWWYRFDLPAITDLGAGETVVLRFEGIDTFATVYVDGEVRAESTNMFRVVDVDVTDVVRTPGRHVVAVRLERPWARIGLAAADEIGNHRSKVGRQLMRKAQFGFGWDFGPNQPSIGLWRPVTVHRRREAHLDSVRFQTLRLDGSAAVVAVDAFVGGQPAGMTVLVSLTDPDGRVVIDAEAEVVDGVARHVAVVHDPALWWPHDHGTPALHDLKVVLRARDDTLDRHESRVGIRTIELDESPNPERLGTRFFRFVVNGRVIFAKGANWVPADMAVGCVTGEDYRRSLIPALEANMNMVRIWGGGVYEHDAFYDLCDELGILVWQEFMFACAQYPDNDPAWLDDIRAEAVDQVRRLRSHACLALWCGNNEVEAIVMIGDPTATLSPGRNIFNAVLPSVVAAEDGVLGYIPTSPMLGNDDDQADRHGWDVWHGISAFAKLDTLDPEVVPAFLTVGQPVDPDSPGGRAKAESISADQYLTDLSPFPSEFGLRAMPSRPTLEAWIDEEHLVYDDVQITARNRDVLGPTNKIELSASLVAGPIGDLDDFIDLGQFTQAEGLKLGVDHFRRRWPHTAGTLIWQLNDCWPGPTWSLVDHAGRPKGALSYAARFYAPVHASFAAEPDGSVALWLVNDTTDTVEDTFTVRLHRFESGDEWTEAIDAVLPPQSSQRVASWSSDELEPGPDRALLVRSGSGRAPANRHFFVKPKDLDRPAAKVQWTATTRTDGRLAVTLTAESYTLFAHVLVDDPAVRFDDNHVDLEAGESRTLTSTEPTTTDPATVRVRWL